MLPGLASLLVLLFLLLGTLAASPVLHETFHADAKHPGHHCAITALMQGHVDVPICDVSLSLVPFLSGYASPFLLSVPGEAANLFPPGRGPPVLS